MSKYLLEIGVEELPYKIIPSFVEQLKTGFENLFKTSQIDFKDVTVYATPRRLAVIVEGLAVSQKDEEKVLKGPQRNIFYDEAGNISKAGEGFLKKNNLTADTLYEQDNYVYAKVLVKGKLVEEVLKDNISNMILKLQGSHFMRWSDHSEKFSRPIRWIVSLLDEKPVDIQIIDIKSSNVSRGHRFSERQVVISHPDEYVEVMRNAHVIVNQNERRNLIVEMTNENAKKLGAEPYYTDDLLEEVTYICEYPKACVCEFEEKYLEIPQEVPITCMAHHQRYFALLKDGKLINKFITITNYLGDDMTNIKAGNTRVIKARLDDAVFFFREDLKKNLVDYVEALKGMTFQKGMGTVYDKTMRLVELSKLISKELDVSNSDVERCALLCKADLATSLVFEFTELQGFIGSDYAKHSKETEKVSLGIKEHYFPLNAEGETATDIVGQIVGIADKMDTVCAVFSGGKKPTGSSDPLGVRRAALGIIKTILNNNLKLDIQKLIDETLKLLPVQKDCADDVAEFFNQRLFIHLSETYKKDVIDACMVVKSPLSDIVDLVNRLEVVSKSDLKDFLESANRVIRIIKAGQKGMVNKNLFKDDSEGMLFENMQKIDNNDDYGMLIKALNALNPYVTKFFDNVLVMDKDEAIKNNRIYMLTELKEKYEKIADFSKIVY